jgi:hypothetical protein
VMLPAAVLPRHLLCCRRPTAAPRLRGGATCGVVLTTRRRTLRLSGPGGRRSRGGHGAAEGPRVGRLARRGTPRHRQHAPVLAQSRAVQSATRNENHCGYTRPRVYNSACTLSSIDDVGSVSL